MNALKKWEDTFLLPELNKLVNNLENAEGILISYVRIEENHTENIKNWNLSVVTPKFWKRTQEDWINEVILSIEIKFFKEEYRINMDISYGTGEIFEEISENKNLTKCEEWLLNSFERITNLIQNINKNGQCEN